MSGRNDVRGALDLREAAARPEPAPAAGDSAPRERAGPADWRWGAGWCLPLAGLVAWELAAQARLLPEHWFPAPSRVLGALLQLGSGGALSRHLEATLARIAAGFVLGALAGTGLGIATGRSRTLRALVDPGLQALRSIPSLAWVPLFMLWLGIGEASKVALIALGVFFPVYLNTSLGLAALDARWLEVARLFGYRGWRLVRAILLPGMLPTYLAGLRSGLGLGWMFVVAAELMGASRGLGYLLVDGQTTSRPELVMAAIALFAVLGKLTDRAVEWLGRRCSSPGPPRTS